MGAPTNNSAANKAATGQDPKAKKGSQDIYSVLTVIAVVLFGLLLGFLTQLTLTSEFLGSGTRLVDKCKANPKYDPEACAPILEARAPAKRRPVRGAVVPDKGSAFQLSDE